MLSGLIKMVKGKEVLVEAEKVKFGAFELKKHKKTRNRMIVQKHIFNLVLIITEYRYETTTK